MAEAYKYWKEDVLNERGEKVDVARFRAEYGQPREQGQFRGTGATIKKAGKVRNSERSAGARGAARNPVMRQSRAVNRNIANRNNR